jgi:hypothetical protein
VASVETEAAEAAAEVASETEAAEAAAEAASEEAEVESVPVPQECLLNPISDLREFSS